MNGRNGGLFTGRGFPVAGSLLRFSFQWFGFSDTGPATPGDWDTIPYLGLVNGQMTWESSASIATYGTTAFNGFVDGTPGSTTMTGSVLGYLASSDTPPTPYQPYQAEHSKLWYVKILAGSMAVESRALLSQIQTSLDVNDVAMIGFNFTLIGIPRQAQFNFLAGVGEP